MNPCWHLNIWALVSVFSWFQVATGPYSRFISSSYTCITVPDQYVAMALSDKTHLPFTSCSLLLVWSSPLPHYLLHTFHTFLESEINLQPPKVTIQSQSDGIFTCDWFFYYYFLPNEHSSDFKVLNVLIAQTILSQLEIRGSKLRVSWKHFAIMLHALVMTGYLKLPFLFLALGILNGSLCLGQFIFHASRSHFWSGIVSPKQHWRFK